MPTRNRKQKFA